MNIQQEKDFQEYAKGKNALYVDDLHQMRGFSIALDADLLLNQVISCNALKSIQDGHNNLDTVVQVQIKEILSMFWSRYGISVVVVMEGLRPSCVVESSQEHEIQALKKSHKIWQTVNKQRAARKDAAETNDAVFKCILEQYGSRFYAQEIINATKEVPNCTYFVAPFQQTAQLAQFYADELIQVAFGTSKLLCHEEFEQAIIDFNVKAGTFTFIDRADLKLGSQETRKNLAKYFILTGAVYRKDLGCGKTPAELQTQLEQACQSALPAQARASLLLPDASKKILFANLQSVIFDSALSLNKERKISSTKKQGATDRTIYGLLFSDHVYYCMSQGLLDAKTLEMIQNTQTLDEVILAPSFIMKEAWNQSEQHSFGRFMGLSLSNLLEKANNERSAITMDPKLQGYMQQNCRIEPGADLVNCRADWNLNEANIRNELERSDQTHVSFYFALRWLQYELQSLKSKMSHPDSLLSQISSQQVTPQAELPKLNNEQQLLSLCYFQYLEANKFIGFQEEQGKLSQSQYLYGQALENSSSDFEESILILLEMLRVYFPAGNPIAEIASHSEYSREFFKSANEADRCSVTLLSRIFSLLNVDLGEDATLILKSQNLDFDLALFNTYAGTFRRQMQFVFQSIMYRSLRENRYDIEVNRFQDTIESLAFKKTNSFATGLLMKSVLIRTNLHSGVPNGFNGSIFKEFGIKATQVDTCLEKCLALWKKVHFITKILKQEQSITGELAAQFDNANTFLTNKLRQLGKEEMADDLSN